MVDIICVAFIFGLLAGIGLGGLVMWRLWRQHILKLISHYYLTDKRTMHKTVYHDFDTWKTTQAYEDYINRSGH